MLYVDDKDAYWLAGLLEGEGCFRLDDRIQKGYRRCTPLVILEIADLDVMDRASRLTGQRYYMVSRKNRNHATTWRFQLQGVKAAKLMLYLENLMGHRRRAKIHDVMNKWIDWLGGKSHLGYGNKLKTAESRSFAAMLTGE